MTGYLYYLIWRNAIIRLRKKVGLGQGYGDIGTRVWRLGTWGRETRDLRTSSMGCGDVWDGEAGRLIQGRGM